ncbi:uncharacterized protein [Montipora capricornis]|uniref:uncharacterized protein n=1 Tax=Montipora capricornis TaxID=246305 RepID=UPI0035F17A41
MATGELYKHVNDLCNVAGGTSLAAIHRALQKDMNDAKWTWKKLTQPVAEKFSPENLNYCQEFVNYIYTVDPYKLKFFDESGIKLPDVGRPNYRHSLIGTPAVETLNLLCGLDGIIYANTIDGTSNSMTFLNFFEESSNVFFPDGKPPYNYGDHIIMDNAPIHHNRAGEALGEWLDDIGCTLVYLPTYSPEFNPAELVFNKLKTILKRFEFRELLRDNLHVAVYEALKTRTQEHMSGFFRFTGYINL